MKSRLHSFFAAVTLAAATTLPATALAGTIGFKTDAKVTAGPGIELEVTLTHTGDETAADVSVEAELLGKSVTGEKVPGIPPGQQHVWNFRLADNVASGVYSVLLRVRYADSNGYEFEIVSTAAAPVGVTPAPKLFGSIDVPRLTVGGQTTAVLNLKKPPERSGTFDVRLVAPGGLSVDPDKLTVDFDESGKATAHFAIRNKDLLAGTSVNLFAFATGNDPGFEQTDTIRGIARVTVAPPKITAENFYRAAGVVAGILVVLELVWLVVFRNRREEVA